MTLTIDHTAARRAMIDSQLRVSGVNDERVLAAFAAIRREDHVPAAARGHAYIDRAIPLEGGRALPAPLVHGMMLVEADLRSDDQVLVVSSGSGYLAALAGQLAGTVETIDPAQASARRGGKGKFSVVLIDGAIEQLPEGLVAELAEGGRIVTGLAQRGVTRLAAGRKLGGAAALLPLAEIGIPVLAEFAAPKNWSF
jgi:protein-L-isoaspartate(D-aspartate) O-methyltransferase